MRSGQNSQKPRACFSSSLYHCQSPCHSTHITRLQGAYHGYSSSSTDTPVQSNRCCFGFLSTFSVHCYLAKCSPSKPVTPSHSCKACLDQKEDKNAGRRQVISQRDRQPDAATASLLRDATFTRLVDQTPPQRNKPWPINNAFLVFLPSCQKLCLWRPQGLRFTGIQLAAEMSFT